MAYHVREEETLDRHGLERLQRRKLAAMLAEILESNAFYRRKLNGLAFDALSDPLDRLPFTTRQEIARDQIDHPPYGTNLTYPLARYRRLHQTSGSSGETLRWLDTAENWSWWLRCWGIIYRAAALTQDDRVMIPFSFGPFIGFWGAFDSAVALGNFTLPAGGMTTTARLRYLIDNKVTLVCCTPTYALRFAEVARAEGVDLPSSTVRGLIVAGEPGGNIPATKARIESAWGARVFDHGGMTEIGPWGFECLEAPGGQHVMESEFIAEVVDPETGDAVADGELGELVLTNLGRVGSPLIRYRTGDQVRLIRGRDTQPSACPCGRWFARAEGGILGRFDDMLLVRGNNVFPSAVEGIVREFDEVVEFAMEVDEEGPMADLCLTIEPAADAASTDLAERITERVRDRLHFKPRVALVKPGALPRFELKAKRLIRRNPHAEP